MTLPGGPPTGGPPSNWPPFKTVKRFTDPKCGFT